MPQVKRYPYQTVVLVEADIGEWLERVHEEDGISKAQALRMAFKEGRAQMERSDNLDELLTEEPARRDTNRYTYSSVPRLSEDDGAWIVGLNESKGVDKSIVVRVALRLGVKVAERKRRAASKIAA